MIYEVKDGSLVPCVLEEAEKTITKLKALFKDATAEELEYVEEWARLIEYPAPKFRRAAIDIEVYAPLIAQGCLTHEKQFTPWSAAASTLQTTRKKSSF